MTVAHFMRSRSRYQYGCITLIHRISTGAVMWLLLCSSNHITMHYQCVHFSISPCSDSKNNQNVNVTRTHKRSLSFKLRLQICGMRYANEGCLFCFRFVMGRQSPWLILCHSHSHRPVQGSIHLTHIRIRVHICIRIQTYGSTSVFTCFSNFCRICIHLPH